MTMVNVSSLRAAFRARLSSVSGLPSFIQHENEEGNPPVDAEWIQERLLMEEGKTATGTVEAWGEYRLNVFTPKGKTLTTLETLTKDIVEAFEAGQSLSEAGLNIAIERATRLAGRMDFGGGDLPLWYFVPIVISWRAFTSSST